MTRSDPQPASVATRPILVHLSPLPESRSGIAAYAATVLMRLARHYECICVVETPAEVAGHIRDAVHVLSHEEYHRIAPDLAAERHLAHLGNNANHVAILDALSRVPAVVVLHDAALFYLMECWAQERFGHAREIASLVRMWHGPHAADLVTAKFEHQLPVQSIYSEVSCLPLLKAMASALITHSQYARVLATAQGYDGPIRVIPLSAQAPPETHQSRQRSVFRARHGLRPDTVLFASLGFVTPNKQICSALSALAALPPGLEDWRYVIGGENRDPEVMVLIRRLKLAHRVILLDYLDEQEFGGILAAADVMINLRLPTFGETSATVSQAMAYGLPCIVTDHGWYAELPSTAIYRVRPGPEGAADLHLALIRSMLDPVERAACGAAAREHARSDLALDIVVAAYRDLIEEAQVTRAAFAPKAAIPVRILPLFPPRQSRTLDAPRRLADVLEDLLRGEQAWLEVGDCRRILLPAPGPGLPGDLAGGDPDGVLTQGFATIMLSAESGFGGLVNLALDAAQALRPGDLLTIALIVPAAYDPGLPAAFLAMRPYIAPGTSLSELVHHVLAQAGFSVLRQIDVPVQALSDEDAVQILVLTSRRISVSAPVLPLWGA